MNCNDAYKLVCEFTQSDSQRKHMKAVAAAMRAYAKRFGARPRRSLRSRWPPAGHRNRFGDAFVTGPGGARCVTGGRSPWRAG